MQPISTKAEAQFRGPSSSQDFNEWMNNSYLDLVQLFNFAAEYGAKIPENMQMLVVENLFLQKRIRELQDIIDNINQTKLTDKIVLRSFAADGGITDMADPNNTNSLFPQLEHDTEYGVLKVPHIQEISKLYLVSLDKENLIPKTLKARVYESTEPFQIDTATITGPTLVDDGTDGKLLRIFDGDKSTFWLRRSVQSSSTNEIYFCIDLELPTNIINHTRANVITLDPTPLSSLTLLDIQFKTINDWIRIDTYPLVDQNGTMVPKEVTELNKIKFCFPTRDIIALRIYGKQTNWFMENGSHCFYYGFRNIDVNYTAFKTETFGARVRVDIPNPSKNFTAIINADPDYPVIPIFADGSLNNPMLFQTYKIWVAGSDGQLRDFNFGDPLPGFTKTFWLDLTMSLSGEVSPLLSGFIIRYESA